MKKFLIVSLIAALLSTTPALADWSVTGAHITTITAYDFPSDIYFNSDVIPKGCYAGFYYEGKGPDTSTKQKNVAAIYSMLLAAKLSHSTVYMSGSFCNFVDYIEMN